MHHRLSARPSQNPHHPLQPRPQPSQPTARNIIIALPAAFVSIRSQQSCPPMRTAYHRGPAPSAESSFRGSVPATLSHHLRSHSLHATPPLGSPLAGPHHPAPRASTPARNTQHHPRIASACKHPRTAQLPADARSVLRRSSSVSCVILSRLGASDAAPAPPIALPACTAAPRLAARKTPPPATAPRATAPAHSTQHHQCTAGVRKHPLTAQLLPMHAAYHGSSATSAASSLRDSVPATLPQLLGHH
jgi:hypothetical protein